MVSDASVGATEGLCHEFQDTFTLLSAGLDDGQHCFNESVAAFTLCAETQLAPNHSVTQAAFTGIVGRLDFRVAKKRPQVLFVIVEFLTHPTRSRPESAQQVAFHFLADWLQITAKSRMLDRAIPASGVLDEQLLRLSHQIVTEAFELVVTRIDQCLPLFVL